MLIAGTVFLSSLLLSLLLITIADFTIEDLDDVGFIALLVVMLAWFILGGYYEWWVWGKQHRREVMELKMRLDKTEQRLRIMETLALRGTHLADQLVPEDEKHESL